MWNNTRLLNLVANLMFALGDVVAVVLASSVLSRLAGGSAAQRALRRASGGVLVALGVRLAIEKA